MTLESFLRRILATREFATGVVESMGLTLIQGVIVDPSLKEEIEAITLTPPVGVTVKVITEEAADLPSDEGSFYIWLLPITHDSVTSLVQTCKWVLYPHTATSL